MGLGGRERRPTPSACPEVPPFLIALSTDAAWEKAEFSVNPLRKSSAASTTLFAGSMASSSRAGSLLILHYLVRLQNCRASLSGPLPASGRPAGTPCHNAIRSPQRFQLLHGSRAPTIAGHPPGSERRGTRQCPSAQG